MRVKLGDYQRWATLATDLVLTAPEVWTAGEQLPDVAALTRFLDDHELDHQPVTEDDLIAVRDLRAGVRRMIDGSDADQRLAAASRLTEGAVSRLGLEPAPDGAPEWIAVLHETNAVGLLGPLTGFGILGTTRALGSDRFRSCSAPTCNGAFIDTSRGSQRRYCMPSLCGNRTNVAAHRSRANRTTAVSAAP